MTDRKLFRTLLPLEEAKKKIDKLYHPPPMKINYVSLPEAHDRILATDVFSSINVPGFNRSVMDGYALNARDTIEAREESPVSLEHKGRAEAGDEIKITVTRGSAIEVATGAPIPKGANAVVMVEYTQEDKGKVKIFKPVTQGENIMLEGSDIAVGEKIIRQGVLIGSREMGLLSALGLCQVPVYRRPIVAIFSTGGELTPPGKKLSSGKIYDVNSFSLMGAVKECGCIPLNLGIYSDVVEDLRDALNRGLSKADVILSSGSTSAGLGDILHKVINDLGKPGVIVHGLAVKPGKPTVIASLRGKLIYGLPGYPTSALTIFHLIVRPLLLKMSGRVYEDQKLFKARLALRIFSAKGRREFLPVYLIKTQRGVFSAYPLLTGSGAITSYSSADGYIEIPSRTEILREGEEVDVTLFDSQSRPVDLAVFGSQCPGVDVLLSILIRKRPGINLKTMLVGSLEGINSVVRGGSDIAGVNILDDSGEYNLPYLEKKGLKDRVALIRGYTRTQGFLLRQDTDELTNGFKDVVERGLTFINRNRASGTRILIDHFITKTSKVMGISFKEASERIKGYSNVMKTHAAVASAISSGRAEVGVCLELYSKLYHLKFTSLSPEKFDFAISRERLEKIEVYEFIKILKSTEFKQKINDLPGYSPPQNMGEFLN